LPYPHDGLAFRASDWESQGDAGDITADGVSHGILYWRGHRHYDSGQQTITSAGALTLAHGLGVQPQLLLQILHNTTSEGGYSSGNEVPVPVGSYTNTVPSVARASFIADATNLTVRFANNANNATGPAQFMPGTAAQYGGNGTAAQKAYMGDLYNKYGSMPVALIAYNYGPGNTDLWLKSGADPQKLPKETQNYVAQVLTYMGQQPQPSANGGGANSGLAVSELGPTQTASMQERGKVLEDTFGKQIDEDANGAVQQNSLLGQMKLASADFAMGPFSNHIGKIQTYINQLFPDAGDVAKSVGSWTDFGKLSGQLVRQAVHDTSSRAAAQEFTMIASALPSASMARPGFNMIADSMGGLNDWKIAKQAAASAWRQQHGTLEGFSSDWNRNVSPTAFWVMRMPASDLQAVYAKLSQTKEGQAQLARLQSELSYLKANNLDQFGGSD